jgi:hypothetical protein
MGGDVANIEAHQENRHEEADVSTEPQELRKDIDDLKAAQAAQVATQAGGMATMAATQAGTVAAVAAGAAGLVAGIFLGIAIVRAGDRRWR